jgi:hypothetical protein
MNFDRVNGLMVLYAVIVRKEYANMRNAVTLSSLRTSTIGDSRRCSIGKA